MPLPRLVLPRHYLRSKRALDVALAIAGLVASAPLGLLVALAIKLSDGGPVFFRQRRIGQHGTPFHILKFRTMVVDAEKRGAQVTAGTDPRITPVGRLLRRSKLDELPQLWNVLTGEMTLVGPRPEVPRYVDQYTDDQRLILDLRPGITDLATLAFRNEESLLRGAKDVEAFYLRHCLPKKIELNLAHARRASLLQDIWVLIQTVCPYWVAVLGIYSVTLLTSLLVTHLLLTDFSLARLRSDPLLRSAIWMVGPQLIFLTWQRQAHGMLSYFSIPEMRATFLALVAAVPLQYLICRMGVGEEAARWNVLLTHLLVSFFSLCGLRMVIRWVRERSVPAKPRSARRQSRLAIVGTSLEATDLALSFRRHPEGAYRVVAFFDDEPRNWRMRPHDIPVFGMPECLMNPEWHARIDEVIIALPESQSERAEEVARIVARIPLRVSRLPDWTLRVPLPAAPAAPGNPHQSPERTPSRD